MTDIKSISSNIAITLVMVVALLAAFAIMATMFAVMLPHREQTVYNTMEEVVITVDSMNVEAGGKDENLEIINNSDENIAIMLNNKKKSIRNTVDNITFKSKVNSLDNSYTISAFSTDTRSRQDTSKEVLRYDSKSQGILVPDSLKD